MFKRLMGLIWVALMIGAVLRGAPGAEAQEVTLKVHHFLPPPSVTHAKFIKP